MKKILLLSVTVMISVSIVHAQQKEQQNNRIYAFGSLGPVIFDGDSDGVAGSLGLSMVVKNKWIISVGYLIANRMSKIPEDLDTDLMYHDNYPNTETKFTYLSIGRYYRINRTLSFVLDGGPGIAKGEIFKYYKPGERINPGETINPYYGAPYTVTYSPTSSLGVIARAGMDWAFSGGAGMGFDFYYNYCGGGISDNVGVNFRLMIGYMPRPPRKAVKQ